MDAGGPLVAQNRSFPCQTAGANYYDFGKTGGKGLNRLD